MTLSRAWMALACVAAWLPALPARAWHSAGHSITGGIAYCRIRSDAELTGKVRATLLGNPDLANRVGKSLTALDLARVGMEENEFLFMRAATWADEVRRTRFDHPDDHFVNQPFTPPAHGTGTLAARDANILTALAAHRQRLMQPRRPGEAADAQERGIALAWIFHLVGDVHQPLHTVARVDGDYPEGDRGGNRFLIEPPRDFEDQTNLHAFCDGFWDRSWSKPGRDSRTGRAVSRDFPPEVRYRNIHRLSGELMGALPREEFRTQLGSRDLTAWACESYELACNVAYGDGDKLLAAGTDAHPTPLSDAYRKSARETAEQRLVLAGYRLEDLLRELGPSL